MRVKWTLRTVVAVAVLGLLLSGAILWAQTGGEFDLSWSTVDGGGGTAEGGAFVVQGTVGQADAGAMSGGAYELQGGFWNGRVSDREWKVFLPLVAGE